MLPSANFPIQIRFFPPQTFQVLPEFLGTTAGSSGWIPLPLPASRYREVSNGLALSLQTPPGPWPEPLSWSPAVQPRFTLCPLPDKGSTIDPGAARSRLCQEMQFTTSLEVTAEEASRLLALLCRYKKPFKGPLCEPRSSLQHRRREAAESREYTDTGLLFKRPNQILNPRNLFPLSMNPGTVPIGGCNQDPS